MGEGDERPEEAGEETRGNRFCPGEKMLVLSLLRHHACQEDDYAIILGLTFQI